MHTKTITQDIDWLREIDGLTVAKAIEYLSKLEPWHVLNYSLEGDTHGVELTSDVQYTVPMTNKEILAMLEKRYGGQITNYANEKDCYTKRGQMERAKQCEERMIRAQCLLDEARAEYGE